jgi:hypothetical protein
MVVGAFRSHTPGSTAMHAPSYAVSHRLLMLLECGAPLSCVPRARRNAVHGPTRGSTAVACAAANTCAHIPNSCTDATRGGGRVMGCDLMLPCTGATASSHSFNAAAPGVQNSLTHKGAVCHCWEAVQQRSDEGRGVLGDKVAVPTCAEGGSSGGSEQQQQQQQHALMRAPTRGCTASPALGCCLAGRARYRALQNAVVDQPVYRALAPPVRCRSSRHSTTPAFKASGHQRRDELQRATRAPPLRQRPGIHVMAPATTSAAGASGDAVGHSQRAGLGPPSGLTAEAPHPCGARPQASAAKHSPRFNQEGHHAQSGSPASAQGSSLCQRRRAGGSRTRLPPRQKGCWRDGAMPGVTHTAAHTDHRTPRP